MTVAPLIVGQFAVQGRAVEVLYRVTMPLPLCQLLVKNPSTYFNVRIDSSAIRGQRSSTGGLLEIPIEYEVGDPTITLAVLSLEGWLRWHTDEVQVGGIRIPTQIMEDGHRLRVPIVDSELQCIERIRGSDPIAFQVHLSGLVTMPMPATDGQPPTGQSSIVTRTMTTQAPAYVSMLREQWVSILADVGFGRARLVELPSTDLPRGSEIWKECMRLFERAVAEFRANQHEKALETCREVVEGIATVMTHHWGVARQPGKNFTQWTAELKGRLGSAWPEDSEAASLLIDLYQTAWSWLSPSHHYGSRIPLYREAEFAMSLCSDLLSFAGHLVAAHPESVVKPLGRESAQSSAES